MKNDRNLSAGADALYDADLEALVKELNKSPAGSTPVDAVVEVGFLDRPDQDRVSEGEPVEELLSEMTARSASDLLLVEGLPPVIRVDGRLQQLDWPTVESQSVKNLFAAHLGQRCRSELEGRGSTDFSIRCDPLGSSSGWRYRVNLHRQRGGLAAAVRALPHRIPSLRDLRLPSTLADLVKPQRGLVLLCGPTGSGKSSTLAALVDVINESRTCHIITIEDPIEYEHPHKRSLVEHIEIGRDAPDFATALRACLRQDPDVILLGEMRDLETMRTALTAAETGHLILSTLHTNDVAQAVYRMIDVFPADQQDQVRQQLALSLHAIVAQQLVPRCDGPGRVPAVEVLVATYPVRHHIRADRVQKLYNEITLGQRHGMLSLEASLAELLALGQISEDEAAVRSSHPDELRSLLKRR